MITIDYNDNLGKFVLKIQTSDSEEFQDIILFCRQNRLHFLEDLKCWAIDYSAIEETLIFLSRTDFIFNQTYACIQELKTIENSYAKETKFFRDLQFDSSVLAPDIKLFNFQIDGISWALKRSRVYIADDPGLGKTLESLCVFATQYKSNLVNSLFLIVRNGLAYTWFVEILLKLSLFIEQDILLISNENKTKIFDQAQDKKIIIVPNHLLADILVSYRSDSKKLKKLSKLHWRKPFVDIKKEWNKKNICLIVDEAHEFKDSKSLRSKALLSIKQFFDYRISLSATPAINYFEDWWMGLHLLDASILPMSHNVFKLKIAKSIGDKYNRFSINSYNIDEIKKVKLLMSRYVLKRLKSDIPEMKTKQIIKPIYLQMSKLHRELYIKFFKNEILKLEEEFDKINYKLIFQKFPYFLQIVDNPELLRNKVVNDEFIKLLDKWKPEKDDIRISYLDEALNIYIKQDNDKILIFDTHPITLNYLNKRYSQYNPVIIHGQLKDTQKDRQYKQDLFNDKDSDCKLFLLQTAIGGAGFNFHYACHREIFYSLPHDATLVAQAKDRIFRITSEYDSIVEMLLLDHSIDMSRYQLVNNRISLNNEFLSQTFDEERLTQLLNGSNTFFSSLY